MNPLLRLLLLLELLWSSFERILERFGQFLSELWDAAPNVIEMADATTRWITSTAGIVLGMQANQLIRLAREQVEKDLHSRLIKPVDCFRFLEFAWSDLIRISTNTNDAGLLEWAAQKLSLWLWHTFKQFKKLWQLLNITDEYELLQFVQKLLGGKLRIIQGYFVAAIGTILIITAQQMFAAVILIYSEDFEKYCLPQDSRRKTSHPKAVLKRVNLRRGYDYSDEPLPPPA